MIYKTEDNRTIVEFNGDVLVSLGRWHDDPTSALVILGEIPKEAQHGGAGEDYPEWSGRCSTDLINPIEFVFSNPVSIDVLMEKLRDAKDLLNSDDFATINPETKNEER